MFSHKCTVDSGFSKLSDHEVEPLALVILQIWKKEGLSFDRKKKTQLLKWVFDSGGQNLVTINRSEVLYGTKLTSFKWKKGSTV